MTKTALTFRQRPGRGAAAKRILSTAQIMHKVKDWCSPQLDYSKCILLSNLHLIFVQLLPATRMEG
jgi:hypothetical protein